MTCSGRWSAWALAGCIASGPALGQLPDWSLAARQRLQTAGEPASKGLADERRQQLVEGERLLSLGHTQAARHTFDRAAMMLHAPDTEAALVRTQMQAGEYRQALAFAAHAAGAHRREWPAGTALYVWLLKLGGQGLVAQRALDEALALAPDDAALLAVQVQLAQPWPHAGAALQAPPLQLAPYPVGLSVPAGARVAGTALLLGSGTVALVPTALLRGGGPGQGRLWLRNGLGQTVAASEEDRDEALGLALLRLAAPLPAADLTLVVREPFGGAPASMVEFGIGDATAAWPLLRQGFFARLAASGGPRRLGIEAPAGPRGGPVFDASGRLAGIAVAGADGQDTLAAAGALFARFGPLLAGPLPQAGADAAPGLGGAEVDEVYERALRSVLQVLLPASADRAEPVASRQPGQAHSE